MKVLLIFPPRRDDNCFFPPTSLLYISRAIKDAGHEAQIIDIPYLLEKFPQQFSLLDDSLYNHIMGQEFDLLGLGGVVSTYYFYDVFVRKIKALRSDVPIVVGGSVGVPIRDVWEKHNPVDFLVEGEGEHVVGRLLSCLERKDFEGAKQIPGLHFLNKEGKYESVKPEIITDLDTIPFLNYDEIDYEYYIDELSRFVWDTLPDKSYVKGGKFRCLPLLTSRGCPFTCTFCFHFNRLHRSHSIDYVIENIKFLKNKYDINGFYVMDDLFTANRRRTIELCDSLYKADLGVYFIGSGGKPSLVTEDMLQSMKRAGFIRFSYGIESGSQKMLDVMEKKTTVEQNLNALELTRKSGIPCFANILFGMPGENRQTILETRDFLIRAGLNSSNFWGAWATAYPGSPLFSWMKERGMVSDTRQYLFDVGSLGIYKYNFTELPFDELRKIVYKVPTQVDMAYNLKNEHYAAYLSKAIKLALIELYFRLPEKLKGVLRWGKNAIRKLVTTQKRTVRSSAADIEKFVQAQKPGHFD
jgi:radical SAM superfamily enzyme YgiQ (UPF0313 family)